MCAVVFCVVTLCSDVTGYQHFGGPCCIIITRCHIPKVQHSNPYHPVILRSRRKSDWEEIPAIVAKVTLISNIKVIILLAQMDTIYSQALFQGVIPIFLHILPAPLYTIISLGQLHYGPFIKRLWLLAQSSLHEKFNFIVGSKSLSS
jgi:hypothetical protein